MLSIGEPIRNPPFLVRAILLKINNVIKPQPAADKRAPNSYKLFLGRYFTSTFYGEFEISIKSSFLSIILTQ